jgi:hypothetical protein
MAGPISWRRAMDRVQADRIRFRAGMARTVGRGFHFRDIV